MDSYIFIDGLALWVLLACVIAVLIGIICLGCMHIKALKENYGLKIKNQYLSEELNAAKDKLYKETFKKNIMAEGKNVQM